MANKKVQNTNKYASKKTTTNSVKKGTTSKKTTKSSSNAKKATTSKKTVNKNVKKTVPKKTAKKEVEVKNVELTEILDRNENIELVNNYKENDNNISKQEVQEKEIIEEISNVETKKENNKTIKKKNKKLLAIGIFVVLLGIVALFVSLVANRIVDREFMNDSAVTLMMVASIIIEGFGAFIIINES